MLHFCFIFSELAQISLGLFLQDVTRINFFPIKALYMKKSAAKRVPFVVNTRLHTWSVCRKNTSFHILIIVIPKEGLANGASLILLFV